MELRVLELFSGVGGMSMAADLATNHLPDITVKVVAAVDINTVSNEVYRHNHPTTRVLQRNILGLGVVEVEKMGVDMVLMSPPCQPHTRQGMRKDTEDPRSSPLSHLLTVLPKVLSIRYILLENVAGFETSQARQEVITVLAGAGFRVQEFLVCPRQMGVPNSRLRYYILAKRGDARLAWSFAPSDQIHRSLAVLEDNLCVVGDQVASRVDTLEPLLDREAGEEWLVPDKVLGRHSHVLDLVNRDSGHSCCFTSGYTRYYEGTGSVIQQTGDAAEVYTRAKQETEQDKKVELLKELRLRFFTTGEVARLMGFSPSFTFPPTVTRKQQYKVLGNSINVSVVGLLLYSLLK